MDYYAKLIQKDDTISPGISVKDHCIITGKIAKILVSYLPESIRCQFDNTAYYAALHDVGKISPAFQKYLYDKLHQTCTELEGVTNNYSRSSDVFHACVSASEISHRKYPNLHTILAMHHGFSPKASRLCYKMKTERSELIQLLSKIFNGNCTEIDWDLATAIGGIIIIADWLASGEPFSSIPYNHQLSETDIDAMIQDVLDKSGLQPVKPKQISFKDCFGFDMNNMQKTLIDAVTEPGVYVLEAEMGGGKTEAALGAALKMIDMGKANGLYFALPTQLTSNKCYERVKSFCTNAGLPEPQLLHGSSWLYKNDAAPITWCSSKAAILSQIGVGTVDQLIMALINVKHSFIRDYGLLGKVIILDEVHSYDAYCSTILSLLIKRAKRLGCTVIILSATLTKEQKQSLLGVSIQKDAYPMVTALKGGCIEEIPVETTCLQKKVTITESNTHFAIQDVVKAVNEGQQVLWIENTVKEAQEIYTRIPVEQKYLLHASFTTEDRAEKEKHCLGFMGKTGDRSTGRIVIGTQVLEQSLDIDADLLVTRMCPIDMLFQRMGRLWRHDRVRCKSAKCKTVILPEFEQLDEETVFQRSKFVYQPYVLHRSEETITDYTEIQLPLNIRNCMEETYVERDETGKMLDEKTRLLKEKSTLEHEALIASSRPVPEQCMDAETRFSQCETYKMVVIKSFDGKHIELYDGTTYTIPEDKSDLKSKKDFLIKLTQKTVKRQFFRKKPSDLYLEDYDIYLMQQDVDCEYDKQHGLSLIKQ